VPYNGAILQAPAEIPCCSFADLHLNHILTKFWLTALWLEITKNVIIGAESYK